MTGVQRINVRFSMFVDDDYADRDLERLYLTNTQGSTFILPRDSTVEEEFLHGYFICVDGNSREIAWVDNPRDFRANSRVWRRVNITFA